MKNKTICSLFDFTEKTLYNWKKENRPVIELLEKYFSQNDLEEFLDKKEISKWDFLKRSYAEEKKEDALALKNILRNNLSSELRIIFINLIFYISKNISSHSFYNMNDALMHYVKNKNIDDSVIHLNNILNSEIKNKSFIPFIYEVNRNDFLDLLDDTFFKLTKHEILVLFHSFLLPYWKIKYDFKIDEFVLTKDDTRREIIKTIKSLLERLKIK